jgi:hypothetical protein
MSIKTIKQRIALVAATALTAGMITVVSVPVANASIVLADTNNLGADTLVIWHTADTDGTPDTTTAVGLTTKTANQGTSIGWVSDTTVSGTTNTANVFLRLKGTPAAAVATSITGGTGGAIRTAAVLPGAKISFILSGGLTSTGITAVVTGGTLGSLASTSGAVSLSGAQTSASVYNDATLNDIAPTAPAASQNTPVMSGVFSISGAAGTTATLTAYSGSLIANGDTRTSGALIGTWTFTVVAASASGTFSAADSTVTQQACKAKSSAADGTTSFDVTSRCANGTMGVVYVSLKDAYSSSITGGSLTATATGGSLVNVVNTPTSGANYAASAAFASTTLAATNYVVVTQPVAGVGGSTTVTITHQGNVIGTKTINWGGDVASIVVDTTRSAKVIGNGQTTSGVGNGLVTSYLTGVVYVYKDAAGNVLSGLVPTMTGQTGAMLGASLSTTTGNLFNATHYATFVTVAQSSTLGYGASSIDHPGGTATANYGAGSYQIQVLNSAGTAVKSNVVSVTVAKLSAHTFEASFDKASYSPGDIATLTITAKDDRGNLMASGYPLAGLSIVTGTGLTVAGDTCTAASTFTNGVKTCSFGVGNTGGAYAWSVALTTASLQTPAIGSVKVVDGAVSNAEVLKSIVALIASINKQIAALQKLILKR